MLYHQCKSRVRRPLALVLAGLLGVSCGKSDAGRPDILLITVDTTRADRVGTYGDHLARTPVLDALAASGAVFPRATCQIPLTAPSHASILTAAYPPYHGVRKNGGFALDPAFDTLPEILHDAGYKCGAFLSSFALNELYGFAQGFEVFDDIDATREFLVIVEGGGQAAQRMTYPERHSRETIDAALAWLAKAGRGPVFMWVHVYDPHTPYEPPAPFDRVYAGDPYRGEMAAMDQQLGRLLDAFATRGPTIVALAGDHGEAFGEKGEHTHGFLIYESTMHIPFMLAYPGKVEGDAVREDLAQTIDLMPTILSLAGVSWGGPMQGRDLSSQEPARDVVSYMESLYGKIEYRWSDLRAIRSGDWKLIRGHHDELYDLGRDPGENANRAAEEPAVVEKLQARLPALLADKPDLPDTAGVVEVSPEEAEALAALGYIGSARVVKNRAGLDENLGIGHDPRAGVPWANQATRIDSLAQRGQRDSAIVLAERVGSATDAGPVVRLAAGGVLFNLGQYQQALTIFEAIQQEDPNYADVYVNIGASKIALLRFDEAREPLDRALSMDPDSPLGNFNLGRLFVQEGKLDSAIAPLRKTVEADSRQVPALILLSKIYLQKGYAEDSYKTAVAVLQIQPNNADAREIKMLLERQYPELVESTRQNKAG
jgi:arylsulfatase A-like enzyme/predicted negative regulator of RcsB-dependent stress response